MSMPTRRRYRRHRGGYVLVLFALLFFGLLALAALVIDLGFARLTQRQMQTAADGAALEGLRFRDGVPEAWLTDDQIVAEFGPAPMPQEPSNPDWVFWLNGVRRWAASRHVRMVFDDDLNPTDGDLHNFGAGPEFELSGGVGDPSLNASQILLAASVYKPSGLESNLDDQLHGDMVAGTYTSDALHGDEQSTYDRSDFATGSSDDAFLVRMRRTNNFAGLDEQPGVSSCGPALPYLFGRGSLIAPRNPAEGYSPRHHGLTVRATAIAKAQPVVRVGPPITEGAGNPIPGAIAAAVNQSDWDMFSGTGIIPLGSIQRVQQPRHMIGEEVTTSTEPPVASRGYLSVLDGSRVVGFGWVEIDPAASQARVIGHIAPWNATARLGEAWDALESLSEPQRQALIASNQNDSLLLSAPLSVR
jgi:hypothetical protein